MAYKKSQETQIKIVDAATRLFRKADYDDVSMDDITSEAGIARTTLYYYFKNKYDVADAVIWEYSKDWDEKMSKRSQMGEDPLISAIFGIYLFMSAVSRDRLMKTFLDTLDYSNYDTENLLRIEHLYYHPAIWKIYEQHDIKLDQNNRFTIILTLNAVSRAICKGVINGNLKYTSEQMTEKVFSHILYDIPKITRVEYEEKRDKAFHLAAAIEPPVI